MSTAMPDMTQQTQAQEVEALKRENEALVKIAQRALEIARILLESSKAQRSTEP